MNRFIAWVALIPLGLGSYLIHQYMDKDTSTYVLVAATCAAAIIVALPPLLQRYTGAEEKRPADQSRSVLPSQLIRDIPDFTGRETEQHQIRAALEQAARGRGTAVVVSAINGMAGVGKSALAIHVAHQVKKRFPDGILYVDLRGAEGTPLDPATALAGFIQALDATVAVPESQPERETKYRALLAGKRVLIVLDNARDEAQVEPLLPGSPPTTVVITSRHPLSTLEGATYLKLEVMPEEEALDLLARLVGGERVAGEASAARDLVRLCGYLPLAVRIAGARLRARPDISLVEQVGALRTERGRLEELKLHNLDVRASFMLSYRDLDEVAARLFRLLGFLRGPDFNSEAAIPLLDLPPDATERALSDLVDAQLLEPIGSGRYRQHDLLRLFSQERLEEDEGPDECRAALQRLAAWYVDVTGAATSMFSPEHRRQAAAVVAQDGSESADQVAQDLLLDAIFWFDGERDTVLAIASMCAEQGLWEPIPPLAANLVNYFALQALWRQWEESHQLALQAARELRDRQAESVTLNNLGMVYQNQGRWEEAIARYEQSLQIHRELGDRHGEGSTLNNLGIVYRNLGRWEEAIACYEQDLAICRELGDRHGEGQTLNNLGVVYQNQGRWEEAIACYEQSLQIKRELGDRHGEGQTLTNLGNVYKQQERWEEAIARYEQSLQIHRELGDRHGEGRTLNNLGIVYRNQGRWEEAIACYEQDLAICRELGDRHGEGQTLTNLGNVYKQQGQTEEALTAWHNALAKLHPDSPEYRRLKKQMDSLGGTS